MDYNAWKNKKQLKKNIMPPRDRVEPLYIDPCCFKTGTLPLRQLYTTSYRVIVNLNIFSSLKLDGFFWSAICVHFLHNFFIIDVISMDSFLCLLHVSFKILKISPLRLAPFSFYTLLWKCVLFLKLHKLQWYPL